MSRAAGGLRARAGPAAEGAREGREVGVAEEEGGFGEGVGGIGEVAAREGEARAVEEGLEGEVGVAEAALQAAGAQAEVGGDVLDRGVAGGERGDEQAMDVAGEIG